ncbi:Protein pygopus like protein [Argiope bruennichi]|uniref:Protein pygopus like protein n=1 Tax=Argiope bruennichi TaxID=94029 RepID=A0A8T0ER23_ARGBR|nr:Protein pygopus like protein [Argiope bruennichi]
MPREERPAVKFQSLSWHPPHHTTLPNTVTTPNLSGHSLGPLPPRLKPTHHSGLKMTWYSYFLLGVSNLPDLAPPQPLTGLVMRPCCQATNPTNTPTLRLDTIPATPTTTVPNMTASNMTHISGPPMHTKPVPMSSGKLYPPDQPMVFNPQNPNAPPNIHFGNLPKEVRTKGPKETFLKNFGFLKLKSMTHLPL